MNYVYARVSTIDKGQSNDRQKYVIGANIDTPPDKIFEEKISGTKKALNRPIFEQMCGILKEGDTIYFESMSRLGRSTTDLIDTVNYLSKERKVNLIFIKENIRLYYNSTGLDAVGTLFFNIMASLSQFERDLLSMRVKESLASKKEQGIILGRRKEEISQDIIDYIVANYQYQSTAELMLNTKLKKNTLFKIIKQLKSEDKIIGKRVL